MLHKPHLFQLLLLGLTGLACVASAMLTGWQRETALKRKRLDIPNARSSHTTPTPTSGGISIVVVFLSAVLCLVLLDSLHEETALALIGGGLLIGGVGYYDDRHDAPATLRILVHFTAATWALVWLGGIPPITFGAHALDLGWLGHVIGLLALVWLINLYNFMDGIDGLSGSEAAFVGWVGGLLLMDGSADGLAWAARMLAAASLGFVRWNWPPARIFMGDVGSGFIGFTLGVLAIDGAQQNATSFWSWLILLGVFAVDATVTLLQRARRGARLYEAHRSHAYQHAVDRCGGHRRVTLSIITINILWLTPCAYAAHYRPNSGPLIALVALAPLLGLALYFRAGQP